MQAKSIDEGLLRRFDSEVWSRVPHLAGGKVVNPTPLVEVTAGLLECAKSEYGLTLQGRGRVFAKLDSKIHGGSVKVRPAANIVRGAIASGALVGGQTVFEATSGNFGLALGELNRIGVDVVAIVSRRLQQGVTESLKAGGIKLLNLDIDICPAPGLQMGADLAVAKGLAMSLRQQIVGLGYEGQKFDAVRPDVEAALARQDAIGLAKVLAKAYDGFCTEQYSSELNVDVHRTVTGPELDQQLAEWGTSLGAVDFVCAFGTGGTAGGVGRYVAAKYGRKGVRVVFPLAGQDVAGIRTREKAAGLKFYEPETYRGSHEADFEEASRVFEFFNRKGTDVGESGALALYGVMQLMNYGVDGDYVVMIADGSSKYAAEVKAVARRGKRDQVRVEEAASAMAGYGGVIWTHNTFVPRSEGIKAIASSLGCPESEVKVADVRDVQAVLNGAEFSDSFEKLLPGGDKPVLVVCMAGNTSLMVAKVLERRGVPAESLIGGITGLPAARGRQPFELVQMAR
jgi:cysteine synthase